MRNMKNALLLTALCLMLALSACASPAPLPEGEAVVAEVPTLPSAPVAPVEQTTPAWQLAGERPYSTWAVYWDTADVLAELAPVADTLGALCYFEAFFTADGALTLPDAVVALYASVEESYPENAWQSYLTFVNDVQKPDGSFDLKSAAPLRAVLADTAAMDAHSDALIDFTRAHGFDGVEIDYEAIRKAPELWQPFVQFCERLYAKTQAAGLGLRVVLEPIAPYAELRFPYGPTYVIMCYNLHGGHNDAGPKADYDFLNELMQDAATLPTKPLFALATGGYDWDEHGDATQVTLRAAHELYTQYGQGSSVRDGRSGAIAFRYQAENGKLHTVWCADKRTLALWAQTLQRAGYPALSFWRLGGNYIR
ncbi:MAG: glycosyl hydrolase family 18 protein [Clostridia bacterium]|nr:glycosyl hydrolase family 18 protein [Clostridia bacterium]